MVHFGQIVSFIFGQDFLRHEQETLKANASQIDQALQALDPVQCTLGPEWIRGHVVMGMFVCEVRWLRYAEECLRMGGAIVEEEIAVLETIILKLHVISSCVE